jgi:predicted peroxiredoxin
MSNTNTNTNTPAGNTGDPNKLVVVLSRGLDDERATVAWTLAATGVASGQDVTVFLVSAGVDLVRRGAADVVQMNPKDPSMKDLIDSFIDGGGTIWACPPCSALRGYTEDNFIDGVTITGAGPFHDLLKEGASTLCF